MPHIHKTVTSDTAMLSGVEVNMRKEKIPFGERMAQFMYGRNAMDSLNKFIFWVYIALLILNIIIKSFVLSYFELLLVIVYLFRFMSKNIWKRQKENRVYLNIQNKVIGWIKLQRNKWTDRKTKVYRRCPNCKKTLRLPKKKGVHGVDCPCCHHNFNVKV